MNQQLTEIPGIEKALQGSTGVAKPLPVAGPALDQDRHRDRSFIFFDCDTDSDLEKDKIFFTSIYR
jgi:hypothetical protein